MNQSNKPQLWAEIIEQQSESELSIVAFCKANQLTVNTFYYWRKKLYGGVQRQVVHPVVIEEHPKINSSIPSLLLTLPTGITLELPTEMPAHQIQNWLQALTC
ncbi:IS66 family insertion sequence element accessory protein TnpB [Vibrio metschnikovii]|uniref:IS66 family insertion sequence element accessory protein TnpA n=1 Tax=Vibrio metschnikovii TaxID=28172 RepID=UPI001C310FF3|nr:transposase [Vibrio metschnikovii]EKO3674176.1 IS66 family insertion sequence element accessory protein TnpB [Vibrio metschnikovii]EKO3895490.1 IS66 family insertion sequence element accessory protein TnpB [Vibrio metschnikovii]EKO3926061.1 IS66 family insertion sequence element accessory protein TnpB [Vibrio metschnikovii]